MNLSEKDTKILAFVVIVILVGLYYFVPYKQMDAKKNALNNEVATLNNTYNLLAQDILRKEEFVKEIEEAKTKIEALNQKLPANLPQELIIYTINDLEKTIGVSLPNLSISPIEIVSKLNEDEALPNQELGIKCMINSSCKLTYNQLKKLMGYLYKSSDEKRIVLNNLVLTSDPITEELMATFSLAFYGLVAEGRTLDAFDLGNFDIKKSNVFSPIGAYGIGEEETTHNEQTQDEKADFFIILDPITADNTTVVIGQNLTTEGITSVHADDNKFVNVELSFYQSNGKYYYRYKAGSDTYPKVYSEGIEFNPGNTLELQVISSQRNSQDDNSGANATIINNTDMPFNVVYFNEDQENPRLNITKIVGEVVIH